MAKSRHASHGAVLVEVFVSFGTSGNEVRVEWAHQFLNLAQVVVVLAPLLGASRLEQQVASQDLVHHAPERPDVGCLAVALAKDHFRGSILSSLDLSREVMVFPAGIA